MKLFSGLVLAAALASSAHADTVDADKFIGWFEKLADTTVADQNDCGKLSVDINKSVDDNKVLLQAAQQARQNGQQFTSDQMNRVMAAGQKIAQAVAAKCAQDKGVHAAIARLPGRPQK